MNIEKIVITGGPSTGKTSIIEKIEKEGFLCFNEISREITLKARQQGIPQLFISDPLLFSERIIEGRIKQFKAAEEVSNPLVFFDRGIPDVVAYMDCFGQAYGDHFVESCKNYRYDHVFLLPPWKEIHESDNERYENFEEALRIHTFLEKAYTDYGYKIINVPKETVEGRVTFILNKIKNL
ncbi:ATP-binding protein [Arenibacter sp. BSSL-BM3]|uniref:ATP-binding protein n=1 Tax=Arenibacter arenosicollis TaxID=2762274 RepID=A0ABR7QMK2_9FLAO|nr:ATP-binding protein [Arenibacter arenosicollis]MBC8768423.1 ATP-binding protein [Arenibacter arenosicollis]